MKKIIFLLIVLISGCTVVDQPKEPPSIKESGKTVTLKFISFTDFQAWMPNATDIRFGIAMSKNDITSVNLGIRTSDKDYVIPNIPPDQYKNYVVKGGIRKDEEVSILLKPGIYDWLILIDQHNKNIWENHVGTTQSEVQMDQMEFKADQTYCISIDVYGIPRMSIGTPDCSFDAQNTTRMEARISDDVLWDRGIFSYNRGDFSEAASEWAELAQRGDGDAQYNLAVLSLTGQLSIPIASGLEWLKKAAGNNKKLAQFNLAQAYFTGTWAPQDFEAAFHWAELSAKQGNAEAQALLGFMYWTGRGVTPDLKKSSYWTNRAGGRVEPKGFFSPPNLTIVTSRQEYSLLEIRKKAESGDAPSQNILGTMYENGDGVDVDYAKAVHWYQMASDQGLADAQWNLANMYMFGRGVAIDYKMAFQFYLMAAKQGHVEASYKVGWTYDRSLGDDDKGAERYGIVATADKAIYWYKKAAEQNFAKAQERLGQMYLYGFGIPVNYDAAEYWLTLAMKNNAGNFAKQLYDYLQTKKHQ